jgi:hypothetical protein
LPGSLLNAAVVAGFFLIDAGAHHG